MNDETRRRLNEEDDAWLADRTNLLEGIQELIAAAREVDKDGEDWYVDPKRMNDLRAALKKLEEA